MTIRLAEGVVTGVQTYLAAHFAAKIAALNSEYHDGIVLTDLGDKADGSGKAYYRSEKALASIPNYPAVYLIADSSRVDMWNAKAVASVHRLYVGIVVDDTDVETLRFRTLRYVRALWELLMEGSNVMTSNSVGILVDTGDGTPPEFDYSEIYAATQGSRFLEGAHIAVSVEIVEVR